MARTMTVDVGDELHEKQAECKRRLSTVWQILIFLRG